MTCCLFLLDVVSTGTHPYSDFDAPVDELNPLDTSAAAVVASAAIELYRFTNDAKYLDAADSDRLDERVNDD